jgi:hypothetical protein
MAPSMSVAAGDERGLGLARGILVRAVETALMETQAIELADMLADYMDRGGELASRLMAAYGRLRTDPCCSGGARGGGGAGFTRH